MSDHAGEVFVPGDILENLKASEKTAKVVLGPGLRHESEEVVVSKPGILRHKEPNIYWVDSFQKRVSYSNDCWFVTIKFRPKVILKNTFFITNR